LNGLPLSVTTAAEVHEHLDVLLLQLSTETARTAVVAVIIGDAGVLLPLSTETARTAVVAVIIEALTPKGVASVDTGGVDTGGVDISGVVDNEEDAVVVRLFAILVASRRGVATLVIGIVVLKNVSTTALTVVIVPVVAVENVVRVATGTTHSIVPVC
jgi:hypothetical protein